jgi:hypothetical protein
MERVLRFSSGDPALRDVEAENSQWLLKLRGSFFANHELMIEAADFLLGRAASEAEANRLEGILSQSTSIYRVGNYGGRTALVKRVVGTAVEAAEAAFQRTGRAEQLLAAAWQSAFGLNKDPSASYRSSVRAVEAAAAPIIAPDDPRPSLGKMIVTLRDAPQKWRLTFSVNSTVEPMSVLRDMMQLLWTNEYSRHVSGDESVPLHIRQEEAEAAAVLALTLVQWLIGGHVRLAS